MKKWKLPKKVSVAGIDYEVKCITVKELRKKAERDKTDDGNEIMGLCDYSSRTIYINRKLNPQELKFTFAHEVLHAVMDGVTQDETYNDDAILHPMSRIFWGVLRDIKLID